jgi:adenylate cyclase
MALYDPQKHPRPTINTADPRLDCLSYGSWTLWSLGYPVQALKKSHAAVAIAVGLSHPFSLSYALGDAALFHLLCRERKVARERAEATITLAIEQGFPYWMAFGTMVRGWALAEQGQVEEGIAQMRQSLVAFQAMGTEVQRPHFLALLAEAHTKKGQIEEGRAALAEALALVDKTGERYYEAELYRLKGELLLTQEGKNQKSKIKRQKAKIETSPQPLAPNTQAEAEAEACFLKAIEISQRQQAKSLELRATTSLARFWQRQGKKSEAHKLLSEIYNWFTEGFDTKDLQEAKMLLEELS